ncbi:hypothetical protein P378_05690 [Desulforamulus profundi]|uniref:OB domain-containing protein n=2 Tax=Desulforamulus profundi TaxID=1383067 RepID=A0A2C6MI22_9FIRM|nr:hypothetical protein P378_05690 [Desulforamulus profundi]
MPDLPEQAAELQLPEVPKLSAKQQLEFEKEALGLYISGHPLSEFNWVLEDLEVQRTVDLADAPDGQPLLLAGMISTIKRITSRKGDPMAFVNLEDLTGNCEVVVFPEVCRRYNKALDPRVPLLVKGRVNNNGEEAKVLAEEIMPLDNIDCQLWLRFNDGDAEALKQLEGILTRHPGNTPVYLFNPDNKKISQLENGLRVNLNTELKTALTRLLTIDNIKIRFNLPGKAPVLPPGICTKQMRRLRLPR